MALDPDSYQNNWCLGDMLYQLKRWEEAVPPLRKACGINADWICAYHALALLKAGRAAEAKAAAEKAAALPETRAGTLMMARFHAVAGDRAGAIRLLRRTYELVPPGPDSYKSLMKVEDFAPLHGDPAFEKILLEVKARSPMK